MNVSELKKLTPLLEVAVLDLGARYLVTLPDDVASEQGIAMVQRALNETGLRCIVVPAGFKFYHLEPESVEIPLAPRFKILYYPHGSEVGTQVSDTSFTTEDEARTWTRTHVAACGDYKIEPIQ